ncbi:MAG TPA: IPT/TIG domain-containing protein, partial [Puia sp.]|nr:IPT/TIG domain-containing protein [Puia sp.]
MKKLTLTPTCISVGLSILFFLAACKKDTPKPVIPSISTITPMQDTVGAQIVINGTGFSTNASENIVKFGDVTAVVVSATATQIIVIVPAAAQSAPISVTVNGNMIVSPNSFTVVATQHSPLISGFAPSIIGIGYPVTITGINFNADSTKNIVTINGVTAKLVSSSTTQLVATVPLTAITGKIMVTVNAQSAISTTNITIKTLTVTTIAGGMPGQFTDGT